MWVVFLCAVSVLDFLRPAYLYKRKKERPTDELGSSHFVAELIPKILTVCIAGILGISTARRDVTFSRRGCSSKLEELDAMMNLHK